MSNGSRAAERLAVRLTKGALVAVLVGGMTAVAAAARETPGAVPQAVGTSAESALSVPGRTGQVVTARALVQARSAVVDVAAEAVVVAHAAQRAGQATDVDSAKLSALESATDKLEDLVAEARLTPVDTAAVAEAAAAQAAREASKDAADEKSPESSKTASTSSEKPDAAQKVTSGDVASDDRGSADDKAADAAREHSASPTTAAPPTTAAGDVAARTAPSAPAIEGPLTSAAESPDLLASLVGAADDPDAPETVKEIVVPKATGPEDSTTVALRAALDDIVELAGSVADTAAERQAAEDAAEAKRAAWALSLQGYANGRIPASALCHPPFDGRALLRCDAADSLIQLDKAYRAEFGTHVKLTDTYRSYGGQVSCRARKGSMCAMPGTSNHGTGVAIDFGGGIQTFGTRQHRWMVANAAEFGWHHPAWARAGGGKPEAWHWEYSG
jgi:hypothetical protein